MVVVTKSIAPLDPQLVERLTTTLGPPKTHTIQRDEDRDLALNAWVIGRGEVRATPDASKVERGTTVEIVLTDNFANDFFGLIGPVAIPVLLAMGVVAFLRTKGVLRVSPPNAE